MVTLPDYWLGSDIYAAIMGGFILAGLLMAVTTITIRYFVSRRSNH